MASQTTTAVKLPKSIPFPVTVVSIQMEPGQHVSRHTTILHYKYWEYRDDPEQVKAKEDTPELFKDREVGKIRMEFGGSYEMPIDGEVKTILVHAGDEIVHSEQVIAEVLEPCTHPIQYSGLCAVCGKDLEEVDYSEFSYRNRNSISVSYGSSSIKMSMDEAERIEQTSMKSLLKQNKLILVVDLDQTVIHATVDPTVGEWQKDPSNPNYFAVKDVQKFSLEEVPFVGPGYVGPRPQPTLCWYYVKLRPGLQEFLEKTAEKYEMHIYTMATRAYARAIASIIDPDGKYFGDRILSRDESGSLTQKSLKRLFPVDQSMVVVIDDRGDVWNWSPNLIKVVPYDFFVGIGDINSSFLPRQHALLGPSKRRKSLADLEDRLNAEKDVKDGIDDLKDVDVDGDVDGDAEDGKISDTGSDSDSDAVSDSGSQAASSSPVDRILALGGGEDNADLAAVQSSERNASLEQQQHDRPLAKLQQDLDKIIEKESRNNTPKGKESDGLDIARQDAENRNLLFDDDTELQSLSEALVRVHNEFYYEFDTKKDSPSPPDVKDIMTQMKQFVFSGFTFLFSGILPLGSRLDSSDIVIWARSFGAKVVPNFNKNVTHVICKSAGTFKVKLARTINPDVKVVHPDWIFKCIAAWEQIPEDDFLLHVSARDLLSQQEVDEYLKHHSIEGPAYDDFAQDNQVPSFIEGIEWDDLDISDFSDSADDDADADADADDTDEKRKRARVSDDETPDASGDTSVTKKHKWSDERDQKQEEEDEEDEELLNELMQELEQSDDET